MPSRFTDRIIQHLAHEGYQPSASKAIARDMRVSGDDLDEFNAAIEQLKTQERIAIGKDKLVRLPSFGDEVVGVIRVNPRGFGFVIPDQVFADGDLFIPPDAIRDAISGDRVRAKVVRREARRGPSSRGRISGRVTEVLERGREHFVGVLIQEGGKWFVQPDGNAINEPVIIRDPHAKNARVGDKVVIELLHYPDDNYLPEGVITKVLGEAGKPDVETAAVIAAHGLADEFTDAVVEEARRAAAAFDPESIPDDREDCRELFTFTIDPPDAKDFDDAISISYDESEQQWTLGVHIADVSHFVKPDTELGKEARARGNSVYLPRLVIPMLPEVLSNGVCSLQEDVPRLAKSAFITYDRKGVVQSQRVASTIIRSNKRLTYLEAQALIDGDQKAARQHARTTTKYTPELAEQVQLADQLARKLRKRRHRDGMIVLDLPDVELVFDDEGHVIDAVPEDDAFTHTIIEMFMVEANEAVARTFSALDVPLIRRIHPDPVHGDMEELRMYARVAHHHLPEEPTRYDLQKLLEISAGTPAARAIHFAVLRTLTKAKYSPALIGHFALASDHYSHFTSPIRRYPDLLVHRVLAAFLDATENGTNVAGGRRRQRLINQLRDDSRVLDEGQLIELGRHCSETEVEAEAAERELRKYLVLQFLHEHHLGEEFPGVVTGVTNRGVYVSIERYLIEGMVAVDQLGPRPDRSERWSLSETTGRLVGRKSGLSLGIGDIITVQIAHIDVASRKMDLLITEMPTHEPAPAPAGGRSKGKSGGRGRDRSKGSKGKGKNKKGRR